jgi:glucose/arabinose dehydrogenase
LLGKIVRISPNPASGSPYSISADNPFVGQAGARGEVWMYGLRNPWRFSFDRANGDMWIGDVGQNLYEEIDYAPAGQKGINWGWSLREATHPYNGGAEPPGGRDPIIERPHTAGDCAITGGYVYRGTAIPALVGAYLYGDYCTGKVFAAEQQGGTVVQNVDLGINVPALTSFGQDLNGELYAVSQTGSVYRITPA